MSATGTLALLSFEAWLQTDEGKICESRVDLKADLFTIFEAGWKAARAESRSDAAEAVGGRQPTSAN